MGTGFIFTLVGEVDLLKPGTCCFISIVSTCVVAVDAEVWSSNRPAEKSRGEISPMTNADMNMITHSSQEVCCFHKVLGDEGAQAL